MKTIRLFGLTLATTLAGASLAQALEIRSATIDGGGGRSSGARYTVSGTVGQPDAHPAIGSSRSLDGGFWPAPETPLLVDALFADGFE